MASGSTLQHWESHHSTRTHTMALAPRHLCCDTHAMAPASTLRQQHPNCSTCTSLAIGIRLAPPTKSTHTCPLCPPVPHVCIPCAFCAISYITSRVPSHAPPVNVAEHIPILHPHIPILIFPSRQSQGQWAHRKPGGAAATRQRLGGNSSGQNKPGDLKGCLDPAPTAPPPFAPLPRGADGARCPF